jgi:hypothetical protein
MDQTMIPVDDRDDRARVVAQLEIWREHLVDLSRANPLLGINRSRTSKLRVVAPAATEIFASLVIDGKRLRMPLVRRRPATPPPDAAMPQDNSLPAESAALAEAEASPWIVSEGDVRFDAQPSDLYKRVRRIRDNARTTVEERGVTTLHLTVGALCWNDPLLGESIAPLWLIPCLFESTGPDEPLLLEATEEEPQVNPALALFMRERFKKVLPPLPEDFSVGIVDALLQDTRAILGSDWQVSEEVWLSTFSFETLALYRDLGNLTEAALASDVIRAFANASLTSEPNGSERLGDDLDAAPTPEVVPIPVLPADSSQLEALAYARAGRHLLVHGPPGTGKSQTIANLIAERSGGAAPSYS